MLKRNVIANFVSQAWGALMAVAFVPKYVHHLGIDAYGLIGFFAVLQAWLILLDLGFAQALAREMARWTGTRGSPGSARDTLRTVEVLSASTAGAVTALVWGYAPAIASCWLRLGDFPASSAIDGIRLMGLVIGVRLLEGTYRGCAMGLQRQVAVNVISVVVSTLRGAGAWGILVWWDASLGAFFAWQLFATALGAIATARLVYRRIPSDRAGQFSWSEVGRLRGLAGGLAASAVLMTAIGQVDKAILSRILPIDDFGLFMLASSLASGIPMLAAPVTGAVFPRLCELHARGDDEAFRETFHRSSQVLVVATGTATAVLAACPGLVLTAWSGSIIPRAEVEPLLRLLALGNFTNTAIWMPYSGYLAHGHVRGLVVLNGLLASALVPLLIVLTPSCGMFVAPWIWLASNVIYVAVGTPLVLKQVREVETTAWMVRDTLGPIAAMTIVVIPMAFISPSVATDRMSAGVFLLCTVVVVAAAGVASAPKLRAMVLSWAAAMRQRPS